MPRRKTYRKRKFPRRKAKRTKRAKRTGLTTKKILDITSVKKRDTMRLATINGSTYTPANDMRGVQLTIPGSTNNFYSGIWCPSFRLYDDATKAPEARNSRQVYWKGLAERVRLEGLNANPIEYRRIVFTSPERVRLASGAAATAQPPYLVESSSNRYWRATGDGPMSIDYLSLIFAGTRLIDWLNPMTAKVDTNQVKVISDKRFKITSGNTAVPVREFKFYDPLNKSMTYNDEEYGGDVVTDGFAATSAAGQMQNVYVLTLMMGVGGGIQGNDTGVFFDSSATVYWHER